MQRRTWLSLVSALSASALLPATANAKGCGGVNLPDTMTVDGKQLLLNGLGLREATLLKIDVYVAGLYLEQRSSDAAKIIEQENTKSVRLSLVRDVSRSDLADQMGSNFRHAAGKDYDKL